VVKTLLHLYLELVLHTVCHLKKLWDVWKCTSEKPDTEPSVVLDFKNLGSAIRGACGQIDPLADPVLGNIMVAGRIPLLDKFGFVARIVSREVPSPLQKFHAK